MAVDCPIMVGMARVIRPWQIFVVAAAGWMSRHQQDAVIEYLREENRVLKQQLGGRRLRLTDAQRRRLAAKGKALGYRMLSEVATIVTPDTILRWHRRLNAKTWDYSRKRREPGRPPVMQAIADLRFASPERPRVGATVESRGPWPIWVWMMQIGRNLTDPVEGFLRDTRFVIMNRNSK